MKNTKTIDLKVNGENFNQNNYQNSDNLDAILVCGDDIAKVRVTSYDEVIIEPITKKNIESKEFINFLDELEDEYNVRNFLISTYYEYLYPFMYDD